MIQKQLNQLFIIFKYLHANYVIFWFIIIQTMQCFLCVLSTYKSFVYALLFKKYHITCVIDLRIKSVIYLFYINLFFKIFFLFLSFCGKSYQKRERFMNAETVSVTY